jgi:hypothetical protein
VALPKHASPYSNAPADACNPGLFLNRLSVIVLTSCVAFQDAAHSDAAIFEFYSLSRLDACCKAWESEPWMKLESVQARVKKAYFAYATENYQDTILTLKPVLKRLLDRFTKSRASLSVLTHLVTTATRAFIEQVEVKGDLRLRKTALQYFVAIDAMCALLPRLGRFVNHQLESKASVVVTAPTMKASVAEAAVELFKTGFDVLASQAGPVKLRVGRDGELRATMLLQTQTAKPALSLPPAAGDHKSPVKLVDSRSFHELTRAKRELTNLKHTRDRKLDEKRAFPAADWSIS